MQYSPDTPCRRNQTFLKSKQSVGQTDKMHEIYRFHSTSKFLLTGHDCIEYTEE